MSILGRYIIDQFKSKLPRLSLPVPPYGDQHYWERVYKSLTIHDVYEWGDLTLQDLTRVKYRRIYQEGVSELYGSSLGSTATNTTSSRNSTSATTTSTNNDSSIESSSIARGGTSTLLPDNHSRTGFGIEEDFCTVIRVQRDRSSSITIGGSGGSASGNSSIPQLSVVPEDSNNTLKGMPTNNYNVETSSSASILILGCGNSNLGEEIYHYYNHPTANPMSMATTDLNTTNLYQKNPTETNQSLKGYNQHNPQNQQYHDDDDYDDVNPMNKYSTFQVPGNDSSTIPSYQPKTSAAGDTTTTTTQNKPLTTFTGPVQVLQCDVSPSVVRTMSQRCSHLPHMSIHCIDFCARPTLRKKSTHHVSVSDATLASASASTCADSNNNDPCIPSSILPNSSMDAVIDKGFMDALFCSNKEQMPQVMMNVHQCLKAGSVFLFFSLSHPQFLLKETLVTKNGTLWQTDPSFCGGTGTRKQSLHGNKNHDDDEDDIVHGLWSEVEVGQLDKMFMYKFVKSPHPAVHVATTNRPTWPKRKKKK